MFNSLTQLLLLFFGVLSAVGVAVDAAVVAFPTVADAISFGFDADGLAYIGPYNIRHRCYGFDCFVDDCFDDCLARSVLSRLDVFVLTPDYCTMIGRTFCDHMLLWNPGTRKKRLNIKNHRIGI